MLMENFLRSKEYWIIVEVGVPEPATDQGILETILNKSTFKNIWDSMKKKYQGNERAKRQQRQALRAEFEVLQMQIGESVDDYFARTMAIANKVEEKKTRKADQDLANRDLTNWRKAQGGKIEIIKLQITDPNLQERQILNASNVIKHNKKNDDSFLFMVCHPKEVSKKNVWCLDTGCSNHMCGDKSTFSDLDESCQDKVKFGDNSTIAVKGRGKVTIHAKDNSIQTISNVLYVPDLKLNLLSLGQLQEKRYEILIKDGVCQIRDSKLGLIAKKFVKSTWSVNSTVTAFLKTDLGEQSRSPTSPLPDLTPEEAWSGRRPAVDYFRIFGCIAYAHVPDQKRSKLDDKGEKCIFLSVSDQSKVYRLYNPLTKKVIISRDVVFDEASTWSWTEKSGQQIPTDFENGEDLTLQNSEEVELSIGGGLPTTPELESVTSSRPQRKKKRPAWLEDYEITDLPQDDVLVNHFALFVDCDPLTYEEAVKEEKWQKAMAEEIGSIERNQTSELTDIPEGHKTIGVKWIYKTKLKENGAIDKFKARLVAKGYKQEFGIDYQEVFAPVATMDTIILVIALATQNSWPIYQLDVKSTFLHGNLQEQVFIDLPPDYVQFGFEHKVYRLKKALYGLKQAPIAWYSRIDAYFLKEGLQKCPYEHTLYIKFGDGVDKGVKLVKDPGGRYVDIKLYKQIVGSLMYMTTTRPDIMHGVSLISKYMEHPKELHLQTAKRILRYLCGTIDFGLFYKKGDQIDLAGFTDSDYAGDLDDKKSTSGFVFMLGSGAISWSSKNQPIVTLSTTEAEYVAATSCACQAI
ncbi:hypothetical protein SLEP1_g45038 [Rubroshorea leprosula]|uniref:Retrovirus-related Pol polyprotein from transposon RE1 n=1 Tax=Rubroshorea leprosula TaxID=152421 RepID=A0AAV5LJE7_9ROSI|nr:hypothetical protein SLEP1_g45038 [Rubroshorea leprosula]